MSSLHGTPTTIDLIGGLIDSGTLDDLIIFLTSENYQYKEDAWASLLLGHPIVVESEILLDKLIERYKVPLEADKTPAQIQSIQFQVINFIASWILCYYYEDFSPSLLLKLNNFIGDCVRVPAYNEAISKALSSAQKNKVRKVKSKTPAVFAHTIPFIDIPEMEIAKQITWGDYDIYSAIRPREVMRYYIPNDRESQSPHVFMLVTRFNHLCSWVADTILGVEDVKERAVMMGKFVDIAWCCKQLENYNSLQAIVAGLDTVPVYRLKKTSALLTKDQASKLASIRELFESNRNFSKLREYVKQQHQANAPCIEFLGLTLTDLVFIMEGHASILEGDNRINFTKLRYMHGIINTVQEGINTPYNITRDPYIQGFMHNWTVSDVAEQHKLSLLREPRGT